jgi:hypothetical protein
MKQHVLPSFVAFTVGALFFVVLPLSAQTHVVSGTVYDASNGQPLAAANIRIDGTTRGTISNAHGEYRLTLGIGSYRLIFSFIGYGADTLSIVVESDVHRDVYLQPVPIQMVEIVVTDEDPAIQIMRKVIENKRRWIEALQSYRFEAFTRQVLRRDTAIATISESYSTGYWQQGDTLREVIYQRRHTANLPSGFSPPAVGNIVNFYDDEVRLAGFRFVGPTAIDAFDYYDYKLLQTRKSDDMLLYIIQIIPKSRVVPLFYGTLTIAGDTYAVAGVEVTPNEVFTFPLFSEFQYRYAQQFALYENMFWMPMDIRVKGRASIGVPGISLPLISFEQVSSIYDYVINVQHPDTIFQKPRRMVTKEAEKFDSTFWAQHEVLPLTLEEKLAYERLDSTQTLERQFRPTGALAVVASLSGSAFRFVDVRFNRVEGLFVGGEAMMDSLTSRIKGWVGLGYGLSDKQWKGRVGAEYFFDARRQWSIGAEYHKGISHVPDENFYPTLSITLMSLFSKLDYRDYYYVQGWKLFTTLRPLTLLSLRLTFLNERQQSAVQTTNYSIFYRSQLFRPNPMVSEGTLRSLSLAVRFGQNIPIPLALLTQNSVEVEAEHTAPAVFSSDVDFTRLVFRAEVNFQTYARRLIFAPTMYLRLTAGTSRGKLPPQRIFGLESRASGTASFGTLYTATPRQFGGDSFVMLSFEHNFRNTPFLALNIPFLYKNSVELLVHGAVAQTWNRNPSAGSPVATGGWYYEAGFGIGRILGLIQLDLTRRFTHSGATFLTVGISRVL